MTAIQSLAGDRERRRHGPPRSHAQLGLHGKFQILARARGWTSGCTRRGDDVPASSQATAVPDIFTKAKRSAVMAGVWSRGTRTVRVRPVAARGAKRFASAGRGG